MDILFKVLCLGALIAFVDLMWHIRQRIKASDLGRISYHEIQAGWSLAAFLACSVGLMCITQI